jgi:hypothetical protein
MAANENRRLAVMIDADNAQASVVQELLADRAVNEFTGKSLAVGMRE